MTSPIDGTTRNKWDTIIPLEELWSAYKRVVKSNGVIALFAQTPFSERLGASNLDMLRYEWIWEKSNVTGFLNANRMPMKGHENILIFYGALPTYNPQMVKGKPHTRGGKHRGSTNYGKFYDQQCVSDEYFPRDILQFPYDTGKIHPTQKPVDLLRYFIRTYTQPNELVLDNTAGSMSTVIACIEENRRYLAFEKDEVYYEKGKERINQRLQSLQQSLFYEDNRKEG